MFANKYYGTVSDYHQSRQRYHSIIYKTSCKALSFMEERLQAKTKARGEGRGAKGGSMSGEGGALMCWHPYPDTVKYSNLLT